MAQCARQLTNPDEGCLWGKRFLLIRLSDINAMVRLRHTSWTASDIPGNVGWPMVQHIVLKRMHRTGILMHMRTTLNIDDALLGRATELSGLKEKTAVVRAGLKALVALESARRLAALGGTERGVRRIRRRRPRPLAPK